MWSLIAAPKPQSLKNKTNKKAQAIQPISIDLDPSTLAPPEPCLENEDPEFTIQTEIQDIRNKGIRGKRGRKSVKARSEGIYKIKNAVTVLLVYTASERIVRPPRRRD